MFSIVIPLMHKPCIKESLTYYLSIEDTLIDEIVVVDFDHEFTINNGLWIQNQRISLYKVSRKKFFNKSFALNIGCKFAKNDRIIVCDADVLISYDTIVNWQKMLIEQKHCISLLNVVETETNQMRSGPGICAFNRSDFFRIQGYDNGFEGWGFEDRDFLTRLEFVGVKVVSDGQGVHLSHDDRERTQNYYSNCKKMMRQINLARFEQRCNSKTILGSLDYDIDEYRAWYNL